MNPAWLSGIGSIIGGLGGLFGSSKPKAQKPLMPDKALAYHAKGAREASDKYGFNPLTLLGVQPGGWPGGGDPGGAPPLASIELITSGLAGLDDIWSGDAARRRAGQQLELDLARLKLDQMRSGVLAPSPHAPVAADSIAGGASLGRRPITVGQNNAAAYSPPMSRPPGKATAAMSDEGTLPATIPLTVAGLPLKPAGLNSDAEAFEARYGEVGAEIVGVTSLATDLGYSANAAIKDAWKNLPAVKAVNSDERKKDNARKAADFRKRNPQFNR